MFFLVIVTSVVCGISLSYLFILFVVFSDLTDSFYLWYLQVTLSVWDISWSYSLFLFGIFPGHAHSFCFLKGNTSDL